MVKTTINHSNCTECGKSLKVHPDSPIISFYKPMNNGPTLYQPIGNQCSKECYTNAAMRTHQVLSKMYIDDYKKNRKG